MTKFDGNAVAVRGRATARIDRRAEMDEWRRTGRHPELAAAAASAAAADRPLPPPDPDRPHVFIAFGAARLVAEVYDDVAPAAARALLAAVDGVGEGRGGALAVTGVDVGAAVYLAPTRPRARPGPPVPATPALQHLEAGVVSVARDGGGALLITLSRGRAFDATHAPAARVVHGDVASLTPGAAVTAAGRTVARGAGAWAAEAAAAASAAKVAVDPEAAAAAARAAVEEAVDASLAAKREREAKESKRPAKRTMLDAVLGGDDGSDDDDSDGESD